MKKLSYLILIVCVVVGVISSCSNGKKSTPDANGGQITRDSLLVGGWVEPINGMEGQYQGIRIEKEGKASSINMATLLYKNWKLSGDSLILSLESIGNGQTIQVMDTLLIKTLSADSLILDSQYGYVVKYSREK